MNINYLPMLINNLFNKHLRNGDFNFSYFFYELESILNLDKEKEWTINPNFYPKDIKQFKNIVIDAKKNRETIKVIYNNQIICRSANNDDSLIHNIDLYDLTVKEDFFRFFHKGINTRHFNKIELSDKYFIKSSQLRTEKIKNEYDFLDKLPNQLKSYFPEVSHFIEDKKQSRYTIKRYLMFDSAKIYISGSFNGTAKLSLFFEELEKYFNLLPKKEIDKKEYLAVCNEEIIQKNIKRSELCKELSFFDEINQICKKQISHSYSKLITNINTEIKSELNALKSYQLYFSHGDLCLSNILYERDNNKLIFIDPKGGRKYRPLYYDLAKITHSFLGKYDYLVGNQFHIENDILKVHDSLIKNGTEIEHKIKELCSTLELNYRLIRLLETSLFLSMIPLHKEDKNRCKAIALNAIRLYNQLGLD